MKIGLNWKRSATGNPAPVRADRRKSGYTLVEVVVAGAILAFTATSLYGGFSAGFFVIKSTRENLRATQIMAQKLESIRLFTWSQLNDSTNYLKQTFTEPYDPQGVANNCGGANYTGIITAVTPAVGEVPEAYRTNMRTVTVTLYWTNFNGSKPVTHVREMQTRSTCNGMQNYIWGS